jgi:hypothetical protein
MESTNQPDSVRPAKRSGCLSKLLGLFVLGVILGAAVVVWDAWVEAPWAHAFHGGPKLTGEWVGEFRAASGRRGALYLEIVRMDYGTAGRSRAVVGPPWPTFGGSARVCGLSDWTAHRAIYGVANRSASEVHLSVYSSPGNVWNLGELRGSWLRERLVLRGTLSNNGAAPHPEDERVPTQIELRPSTEADFEALCQRLGIATVL